jgi:hypothetical protein
MYTHTQNTTLTQHTQHTHNTQHIHPIYTHMRDKLFYFIGNLLNKKSIEIGGTVIPLKRTNLIPNLFPEKPFPSVRISGSGTESRKSRYVTAR